MRVIVAGSRNITDVIEIAEAMVKADVEISELICGGARGVDRLASHIIEYVSELDSKKIIISDYYPDWETHGKKAGFIRNLEMAKVAEVLIAIWDGKSKGTKHMIDIMRGMNKPCFIWNTMLKTEKRYNWHEVIARHRDNASIRSANESVAV